MVPYRYFTHNNFIKQCRQMIQQNQQIIEKNCEKGEFNIHIIDFKLFELIRNFRENNSLIDEETLKKIRNCKIKAHIFWIGSMETLVFLRSLNIDRINDLCLFIKEFREVEMDLIRMTDKNPLLTIRLGRESHFKYKSNIYSCLLYTSPSPRDATLSRMPSSA